MKYISSIILTSIYLTPCNGADRKGELGYENHFRNRPLPGGRDLSCFWVERLPALHSATTSGWCRGTVHGFAFQVIAGVLLLINRYVPLAVAVLAPVLVNILTFHALMAPSGLPLALFVTVLWALIFIDVRPAFSGLFQSRLQPRA
jgi:hypothetical protein